jgi:hypothetical protein
MADRKRRNPNDPDLLEESPGKPNRRRPSERGVGREHSTPPPVGDKSPTSKTPY